MNEADITVNDKAISVNGAQVSWALEIHKLAYLHECLESAALETDLSGDPYAGGAGAEGDHIDYAEGHFLDGNDDIAWR